MMNIKIKKIYNDAKIPTRGSEYAAGYDLYAYLGEGDNDTVRMEISDDGASFTGIASPKNIPLDYLYRLGFVDYDLCRRSSSVYIFPILGK